MGNYSDTKQEVKTNIIARVPLIIIRSSERERIERLMRELCNELHRDIFYYTDVKQFYSLLHGKSRNAEHDPLPLFQDTMRKNRGTTLVLGDARRVSDENAFSRDLLDTLYLALETASTVVLVTTGYVWSRLAQFGMLTALDYPDLSEREVQIRRFVQKYQTRFVISWTEDDIHQAAQLLRGFSEVQIENILSSALVSHNGLSKAELNTLTMQKSRLYASVPCVEEVHVPKEMVISGLGNLRRWVRRHKQVFFLSDDILKRYDLTAPKGILLAGVPGCGKSYSAKMVASEWGLPLFRFDIGAIYDKWMGESERKMATALQYLDSVAPCVVWIDEIEKALSTSDTSNDTGQRILGQFLYWLQESMSRVFLVATANDSTKLPPELFRKGRFSEIFFVDLPSIHERKNAIIKYMQRSLHRKPDQNQLEELSVLSNQFSYADIEFVIKEAAQQQLIDSSRPADLAELFRSNLAFAAANPDAVKKLKEWGRECAIPASFPVKEGNEYE